MPDLSRSSVEILARLFTQGHARIPESWGLGGPLRTGLWWQASGREVVATPLLLRCAGAVVSEGERAGLLLATEPRFRASWLATMAARLADLGRRDSLGELCRQIDLLGAASSALRGQIADAAIQPSPHADLDLALFGAPADQPAATPGLLRVLGTTAPLVEGGQGNEAPPLAAVNRRDPGVNWIVGRLLQAPGNEAPSGSAVLNGAVAPCADPSDSDARMAWVLETPWVSLLAVLVFTQEAWAAERMGGLLLELPGRHEQHPTQPPQIDVVVTLADGREVLCGSLGELCLRVLDALGMAVVPAIDAATLDQRLGDVIAELLRAGVWCFKHDPRTHYLIGEAFGFDCYRGVGHCHIFLGADTLSQGLRGVAVAWARERVERAGREGTT